MPTQQKTEEVALLKEKFERAASLVLADYRGLKASEMVALRAKFTKAGLEFRVVKDTLARIAAEQAGVPDLSQLFTGPIGIAIGYDDPALAFKLSEECRKDVRAELHAEGRPLREDARGRGGGQALRHPALARGAPGEARHAPREPDALPRGRPTGQGPRARERPE